MKYKCRIISPLGYLVMGSDGESLTELDFESTMGNTSGFKEDPLSEAKEVEEKELPIFQETSRWLDIYFAGKCPNFMPPLKPHGTEFQMEVWEILKNIPYGETTTYGEIARILAKKRNIPKMSAQAVGGAVGRNPVAILIPCHRVIGTNGKLVGYGGGMDRKIELLALEQ